VSVSKSKFELLDEALLFEMGGTRRLLRGLREPAAGERARGDFDQALERWLVLKADLDADLAAGGGKFVTDFMAGIEPTLFSARAVWSLRAALAWALGTRSSQPTAPRDDFPLRAEGDVIIRALLHMIDPWESEAMLASMERRVGEALNEFLLRRAQTPGLDEIAEIVLIARDYMFRVEYLQQLEDTLEHHRVRARVELFRPAVQQLIDRIFLVSRELILYGPAVQSPYFTRSETAIVADGLVDSM
jgi:hypothetical protein